MKADTTTSGNVAQLSKLSHPHFSVKSEVRDPGIIPRSLSPHFKVVLLLSGRRIQHLGMRDIEAGRGHMLFLPPRLPRSATVTTKTLSVSVSFDLAFLRPELPWGAELAWDEPVTLATVPELLPFVAQSRMEIRCGVKLTRRIHEMWAKLRDFHDSTNITAAPFARAQLSLMLLEVVKTFERSILEATMSERQQRTNPSRMYELFAFLSDHLSENVTIEDAAKHLYVSSSRLAARLRQTTGKSFGDLLTQVRLMRAQELLTYTDGRVSEIAYKCGFEDHSYFSRRFRQIIGLSPIDYRQRRKSDMIESPGQRQSRRVRVLESARKH